MARKVVAKSTENEAMCGGGGGCGGGQRSWGFGERERQMEGFMSA